MKLTTRSIQVSLLLTTVPFALAQPPTKEYIPFGGQIAAIENATLPLPLV